MQEEQFKIWLENRGITSANSYLTKLRKVEEFYGDIDIAFNKDECQTLLSYFEYSAKDAQAKLPVKHKIPINPTTDKEIYQSWLEGTRDYATRISRYIDFRNTLPSIELTDERQGIIMKQTYIPSHNQILYGPPGTGKTYNTINAALKILAPDTLYNNRAEEKAAFDFFLGQGRISFVTFHQSFSYEDFVEGIRPDLSKAETTENSGAISYSVEPGIFRKVCEAATETPQEPYVLIIDEINRGNISGIFGELITLIEPSKRLGAKEELKTVLPYSRESFGVPDNLYIIGTMNTADRSLTGLDIALRRRFTFVEMPPQPELLEDKMLEGTSVSLADILSVMNNRIEVMLGRDYCLGHAPFMHLDYRVTVEDLKQVFQGAIIPLLQEYFFEDWYKIHVVLNDHKKEDKFKLITKKKSSSNLFDGEELSIFQRDVWEINRDAFDALESYVGISSPIFKKVFDQSSEQTSEYDLPSFVKIENLLEIVKSYKDEQYYVISYSTKGKENINYKIYVDGLEANNRVEGSNITQTDAALKVIEKYKLNISRINQNGNPKVPNELIREILNQLSRNLQ